MDTHTPVNNHPYHLPHWAVILLLLFVPPVAWWHMWKNHRYHTWFPYVLWLNAAITLGFAAYVIVHFYPLLTRFFDSTMYIFASHIGLLFFAIFEIVFGFYLIKMFKNETMLKRKILAIVIVLLFINTISIPVSQLIINSIVQSKNPKSSAPVVVDQSKNLYAEEARSATANWKTYTNSQYNFTFKHPNLNEFTYGYDNSFSIKDIVAFANKSDTELFHAAKHDGFAIAIETNNKYRSFEEYVENADKDGYYYIEKQQSFSFNGQNGYMQEIKARASDKNLLYTIYFIPLPNRSEILRIMKFRIKSDQFEQTFSTILSTFKFLEPESTDPKTGWKIYTDVKRRFTFQYPQIFEKDYTLSYFYARTKKDSTNMLSVRALPTSFSNYSYKDLVGLTHSFDTDKKSWNPSGFKKTNTPLEAYTLPVGDAGCTGDAIVIPHPDYSYVVEATVLHCANIAADIVKPADVDLTTEEFLKTFTFLN